MISLVNGDMPSQWMQRVRGAVAMQRQAPRCPAQPKLNASLGADPVAPRHSGGTSTGEANVGGSRSRTQLLVGATIVVRSRRDYDRISGRALACPEQ